jgi:glycosyltransferase involved in cell wall biosynthesis
MKVVVAQKGAREHFLAARALHQQRMLAGLVTDWYAFGGKSRKQKAENRNEGVGSGEKGTSNIQHPTSNIQRSVVRCLSSLVRNPSARAARAEGIPDGLVRAFPFRSLLWKWKVRRLSSAGRAFEGFDQTDAAFAAAVARLKLPEHDVFFSYSYASLEMLEVEKKRGVLTVLDQIDPGPVEFRLVAEEMRKFPEMAGPAPAFPAAHFDRARREWKIADVIVVNSEWSRKALVSEGVNPAKIEILPLAFETNAETLKAENKKEFQISDFSVSTFSPLRVLWLGQVNVRKGIHYLMEAARLLEHEKVHFDVVGPIGILPEAMASAPRNMAFHGPVSRDHAAEWYRQADVFVLPTLSDGFALTQLEALAHGLPVIVTPNCGRVVENGKTGFIVPPRDPQALADAILRFLRNPSLAAEMRPRCLELVRAFSVEAYGQHLVEIINQRMKAHTRIS